MPDLATIQIPGLIAALDDTEAAAAGVQLNGLYQANGVVRIRLV
jgi:hypothetical protein